MAWFLNPALTRFRNEVNSRWPNRDKASDGTIGDAAHASRSSDHNPDPDGSVDAWDMDVDGVDVAACKKAFEAHEASAYWIHNDRICFRDEGWRPRSYAYAGPNRNRHDKHAHWNSRTVHENSTKPWFTNTEEDMTISQADADLIAQAVVRGSGNLYNRVEAIAALRQPFANGATTEQNQLALKLTALEAQLTAIATAVGQIDEVDTSALEAQLTAIQASVDEIAALDAEAIAAAIPDALAAEVADLLSARLAA